MNEFNKDRDSTFVAGIIETKLELKKTAEDNGINLDPLIEDLERQQQEASRSSGGDPITGKGSTRTVSND